MSTNSQFVSQQSDDLSIYLPYAMHYEDGIVCPSVEMLTASIGFDFPLSAHRMDLDIFDPIKEDMAASCAFTMNEPDDTNDLNSYLHEQSRVIPHMPRDSFPTSPASKVSTHMSPPSSPLKSTSIDLNRFLVRDETTNRERRPLLHEFIRLILEYDEYSYMAEYVDRKLGIFKLHRPKDVSDLWKHVKGRNSDTSKSYFRINNI